MLVDHLDVCRAGIGQDALAVNAKRIFWKFIDSLSAPKQNQPDFTEGLHELGCDRGNR